jgi:YD repeat-containing protein
MTGSGKTVILPGASGEFNATGLEWMTLSKRLFVNEGTVTFPWGNIVIEEGAQLQNRGIFKANAETAVSPQMQGNGKFDNLGTFEKTAGTGTTEDAVPTANYGSVRTLTGRLKIVRPIEVDRKTQYGKRNRSALSSVGCRVGDPVDCQTGNFYESQTDIAVGGRGVGLNVARTYNAQAAAAGEKGAFGYGWTSSFSAHLTFNATEHTVSVVQDEGATVTFVEEGGKLVAPAWTQDELSGNSAEGYSLTMSDQTVYKFSGAGRLESVTDRNGNATTLGYNEKGQLATVTDPSGRKITLAYNGEGLVESATDPMGHVVKYAYESGGLEFPRFGGHV